MRINRLICGDENSVYSGKGDYSVKSLPQGSKHVRRKGGRSKMKKNRRDPGRDVLLTDMERQSNESDLSSQHDEQLIISFKPARGNPRHLQRHSSMTELESYSRLKSRQAAMLLDSSRSVHSDKAPQDIERMMNMVDKARRTLERKQNSIAQRIQTIHARDAIEAFPILPPRRHSSHASVTGRSYSSSISSSGITSTSSHSSPPLFVMPPKTERGMAQMAVNRKVIMDQAAEIQDLRQQLLAKQHRSSKSLGARSSHSHFSPVQCNHFRRGESFHSAPNVHSFGGGSRGYRRSSSVGTRERSTHHAPLSPHPERMVESDSSTHGAPKPPLFVVKKKMSTNNNNILISDNANKNSMNSDKENAVTIADGSAHLTGKEALGVAMAHLEKKYFIAEADDEVNYLHIAVLKRDCNLVRYIVSMKPKLVNKRSRRGDTPLHYAIKFSGFDGEEICRIMLKAYPRAIFKTTKDHGLFSPRLTPLEIAMECKASKRIVAVLLEYTTTRTAEI